MRSVGPSAGGTVSVMASDPLPSEIGLARTCAERLLPHVDAQTAERLTGARWDAGRVEESGQFHRVLVLDDVAVLRMTRMAEAGAAPGSCWAPDDSPAFHLPRRMGLLQALAARDLPFSVPAPLSEVWHAETAEGVPLTAAVLQPYLPGQPHPVHEGDPAVLRGIVDALDAVDVTDGDVAAGLGPAWAFRGPWTDERIQALRALPAALPAEHAAALPQHWQEAVEAIATTARTWFSEPAVAPRLVHGDLAGHNLRWVPVPGEGDAVVWRLAGILDWDLAHAGDPARNVADLAIWHGQDLIDEIARDTDEAGRARVWLGNAALEALDDARARQELTGRPLRWDKLLRKVLPRIERAMTAF